MRCTRLLLLPIILVAFLAPQAEAQEMLPATRTTAGIQYASISTHFAEYYPSTVNAWETFSMQGLSGDRMWRFKEGDTYTLYWGAGATLLIGGYEGEVGIYKVSGGTFPALGVRAMVEMDYPLESGILLLAQAGASLYYLSSAATSGDTGGYFPYDERFDEGVPGFFLGIGVQPTYKLRLMVRFQLVSLGAWTDYSISGGYPEEVDSGYFSLDLGWTLGGR